MLDVPNLWRLEAQHGTFLYCLNAKIELFYEFERITFPYTGPLTTPGVEEIYPRRKSNLELLLDQFFMNETRLEGTKRASVLLRHVRTFHHVWSPDYEPKLIKGASVPTDSSWDPTKLSIWLTPVTEQLSNALTDEKWEFEIHGNLEPAVIGANIAEEVRRRLHEEPGARSKLISWSFRFSGFDATSSPPTQVLSQALQWLWDGLRTLPYDNEDIAIGAGNCVAIYLSRIRIAARRSDPWLDASESCLGAALEVEFGAADKSYSLGYASEDALLKAVREDVEDFLAPDYRDQLLENVTGMIQAVTLPDRLFNFDRLAKVFAREIAPSQVLVRFAGDSTHTSSAIFLSPARLAKFGLP